MKAEEPPNKRLVREGHKWSSKFHMGLGYRICEDDMDLQALALTMRDIKKEIKKELREK